jgi:hypothetical protein
LEEASGASGTSLFHFVGHAARAQREQAMHIHGGRFRLVNSTFSGDDDGVYSVAIASLQGGIAGGSRKRDDVLVGWYDGHVVLTQPAMVFRGIYASGSRELTQGKIKLGDVKR